MEEKGFIADTYVIINGIDIPFWKLVGFMIKLTLAAIPATIILSIIFGLIALVLGLLTGGLATILSYIQF